MKETNSVSDLIQQIVLCGLKAQSVNLACHAIWNAQGCQSLDDFHLPEPWNGDIANAKLLFLSINPGYTKDELYPRMGNEWWKDENGELSIDKINDFFTNRFSSTYEYVRTENGRKVSIKMEDGTYKKLRRPFWGAIHKIASLILNSDVQLGKDYALTEIVHCKTRRENNLDKRCYLMCMSLWLRRILDVAQNVERIVVIGSMPRILISQFVEPNLIDPERYKWYECSVPSGRKFSWLFIDHPAAYQCKSILNVKRLSCLAGAQGSGPHKTI